MQYKMAYSKIVRAWSSIIHMLSLTTINRKIMIENKILLSFLGKIAFLWIYKIRWHKRREKNMTPAFIFIWEVYTWTFRSSFSSSYYIKI